MKYRCGIIGCGAFLPTRGGATGIGYAHAKAYKANKKTLLDSASDISEKNLSDFAGENGPINTYTDYREMLKKENLDIVSICTWLPLHSPMTIESSKRGVKAVWCEKPMAHSIDAGRLMLTECKKRGVKLFVNHQRRYGEPFQIARRIALSGDIGKIHSVEAIVGSNNLLDYGTHLVDMIRFFIDDAVPLWVMAQVDISSDKKHHNHFAEDYSFVTVGFDNGIRGVIEMGRPGYNAQPLTIVGSDGVISVHHSPPEGCRSVVTYRTKTRKGSPALKAGFHGPYYMDFALADIIASIEKNKKTLIEGSNALWDTEIIMGAYESARTRRRVNLPLKEKRASLDFYRES